MQKKTGTLIKVIPTKRKIRQNLEYDSLLLVYRDEHGKKQTEFVDRAEVPFYLLKDKESPEAFAPPMFIEMDKVERHTTYSDMLYREIALKTDSLYYYDRVSTTWGLNSYNMKNLFKHNWLYDTDMDLTDRYIAKFHERYEPDVKYKLHKVFYDIEVDLMENGFKKDSRGNFGYMGFPDEEIAPCPINIMTLFDAKKMDIHSFIVRNKLNTSLIEFENKIEEFKVELRNGLLDEDDVDVNDINIYFFNSEEEAIEAFFEKTHNIDPDFMLAWNASFDVNTMLNRLKKLYSRKQDLKEKNIKPQDMMIRTVTDSKYLIQKDSKGDVAYITPRAYYVARKEKQFVDRMDNFIITDAINWNDQMLLFANIRKGTGQRDSYALDAIADEELGKEKLEFAPGETIKTLPWTNFWKFALYNIRDVVLLYLLEEKNLDFDMVQRLSEITNTRKEKVFAKTVSLKNFVSKYAKDSGFVMTNNRNSKYGEDAEFYEANFMTKNPILENDPAYLTEFEKRENFGAAVADPNMNLPDNGIVLNGKSSKFLFEYLADFDFSSLFPSIIRAYNLDKNTQVGKFYLIDQHIKEKLLSEYDYEGLFAISKNEEADAESDGTTDDLGPTLIDSLISFDMSKIGKKYFDLPSTEDLIEIIEKEK
jgi:DNA polymerase elongation subunit (family B)